MSLSVQTTLYYLRAVLNAAIGYQGMHLPYWKCGGSSEGITGDTHRGTVVRVAVTDGLLWRRDAHDGGGVQGTHGEGAEQDVPQPGRGGETGVFSRGRKGAEGGEHVWHRRRRLAAGKKERNWRALQAVLPGEEHMLATNRTCGRRGPILVLDTDFGGAAHGTVRWIRKEGVDMEVLHVGRKDMKEYKMAGLHHAELYRDTRVVERDVYRWMMRRARGQEDRTRWSRRMRKMWNEWVALWEIQKRKPRCGKGEGAQQEREVLDRGERDRARPGILLCAPLGLKGPRGKVQSATGQSYDVHADMFRKDNIPEGAGQGDQCWRCTKEAGHVPWRGLQMTAWAFPNATMRTTDARGQWWGPLLRLPKAMREDEEAQGEAEVWWGEGQEEKRTGVRLGWDTVRGLQEEDDGVAVSFWMTGSGRPDEEALIVPVDHKCGESARRITLTVHGLPEDRVWYLVLVQAYLEQGRAKGDRAWFFGVVVTKGWKARTDNKWAVYRGVKELSIGDGVREYGIGRHKVYCHYPGEVVRIPEPTEERVVLFLDGSGLEEQPPKAGAAAVRVRGVGQVTEGVVEKMGYGAASHGEVQAVADVVGEIGEEVREVWMVVDAEADMASLRMLPSRPLHEALGTGLASQVYAIWHGLEMKKVPLIIYSLKQESHRAGVGNHEADGAAQAVDKEQEPEWRVPERKEHLHVVHIPPRVGDEKKARWVVEEDRGKQELRVYRQPVHMLAQVRGGPEVVELNEYLEGKVGQRAHYPSVLRPETLPKRRQTRRLQAITGQVPVRETIMRWYRFKGMDLPEEYMRCHCGRGQETDEHFMWCEQYKRMEEPLVRDQDVPLLKKGARGRSAVERELGKEGHRKGLWHMVMVKSLWRALQKHTMPPEAMAHRLLRRMVEHLQERMACRAEDMGDQVTKRVEMALIRYNRKITEMEVRKQPDWRPRRSEGETGARCGAGAGPHARIVRTRDTRVAEPRLTAREDGQLGEGQRLTPDAPHNGGRPPPPGTAPHQPHGTQPSQGMQAKGTVFGPHTHTPVPTARGWRTPTARPVGGQSGEGERLTSDAPHNGGRHPPEGCPSATATASNAGPQRAHAVALVLGPHARTDRTRDTWVAEPRLPAPEDGRPGEGQRLTPDAPHNGGGPPPPVKAPHHHHGTQPPQGMQAKGTVMGPHPHKPAPAARGRRTRTARPVGGQSR